MLTVETRVVVSWQVVVLTEVVTLVLTDVLVTVVDTVAVALL